MNPYIPIVLHLIPRILTNLDRDRDSPTFGCFDRNFWHYKVHDYSSGLLQQCMLTLGLVYSNNFEGNIYFMSEEIRKYSIAGIDYCNKIQNSDGSFDEYWKGESSIPSTAFTLYSICETCDLLKIEPNKETIRNAVRFLEKHVEEKALNQEMASIAAIEYSAQLLNDDKYKKIADEKFSRIISKKEPEGWFSEYGGLDLSYLTVFLDYLIRYYELTYNLDALETSKQIINCIKYFIHPDGSIGGEYGTRNTEYFAPYGIEYLKETSPIARSIIQRLLEYVHQNGYINLSCDERYYLHYLNHSFTKSLLIYSDFPLKEKLPYESTFSKNFEDAKIIIKSTDFYYFIINCNKGGTFKVMDKKSYDMNTDCGYRLMLTNGFYVTEMPSNNEYYIDENSIKLSCNFSKMDYVRQSTFKLLLLRLLSKILGYTAITMVKKIMIFGGNKVRKDTQLTRTISFSPDKIIINDFIEIGTNKGIISISNGLSIRHTASSRFFQINSINNQIKTEKFEIVEKFEKTRILSFFDKDSDERRLLNCAISK